MAAGKGLPMILLGGGALLLMGGKKKKKSKKSDTDTNPYLPEYDDGEQDIPYIPPTPSNKPSTPSKPAGDPPNGDSYDADYWGSNDPDRMRSIRQHFVDLGYPVEVIPNPMNIIGPKGTVEVTNYDGTKGKLGGNDDQPNAIVKKFQHDYNVVSRLNNADKIYSQKMGGLSEDGMVGSLTLNGLRYAVDGLPGGKTWNDILLSAANKGIV